MTVFANGLEVSCKAQGNKIIAATPDTCMTPPESPATPPGVPVPYPSFGFDSDTENGTGTVKIGGKTVSQKNLSYYGKTTGTEAGCAAKKGVVTSTNTGKAYAAAWSSNVKAEGQPVARFSDRATVNHASPIPNDGNGVLVGGANPPPRDKCQLTTYKPKDCPAGETPHHLVGDAQFHPAGSNEFLPGVGEAFKSTTGRNAAEINSKTARAFHAEGLCICLQGMVKSSMKPDEELGEMFDMDSDSNIPAPGGMGDRRLNERIVNATRQNTGRTASLFPGWAGTSPYSNTLGEHGLFHEQYDNIIESIGAGNEPPHTVSLEECANIAAQLAKRMHGCKAHEVKAQIVQHYQGRGVPPSTRLRSGIKSAARSQPAPGTPMGIL